MSLVQQASSSPSRASELAILKFGAKRVSTYQVKNIPAGVAELVVIHSPVARRGSKARHIAYSFLTFLAVAGTVISGSSVRCGNEARVLVQSKP